MENLDKGVRIPGFAVWVDVDGKITIVSPTGTTRTIPAIQKDEVVGYASGDEVKQANQDGYRKADEEWCDFFRSSSAELLRKVASKSLGV